MQELVIISGKGGTGKTSLTAAFAFLSANSALCDADVDAADLHLLLAPENTACHEFQGGGQAVIQPDKCSMCGTCRDMCQWDAIDASFTVDPVACEGCGVCVWFCPEKAIEFPVKTCGQWFLADTRFGPLVHAHLGIAEENSGKLVTLVRQEVKKLAQRKERDLILTDGPPGVGCPVIASLGGATGLIIVTEPTVSGLHDLERVVQLAEHFKVPSVICINKSDLNGELTWQIESFAKETGLPVVGKIPFEPDFISAMVRGQTVLEYSPASPAADKIDTIWQKIKTKLM